MKVIKADTSNKISINESKSGEEFYTFIKRLLNDNFAEKVNIWSLFPKIGFKPIMLIDDSGAIKALPFNKIGTILYNMLDPKAFYVTIHGDVLFAKLDYGPEGPDWFPLNDDEVYRLKQHLDHITYKIDLPEVSTENQPNFILGDFFGRI